MTELTKLILAAAVYFWGLLGLPALLKKAMPAPSKAVGALAVSFAVSAGLLVLAEMRLRGILVLGGLYCVEAVLLIRRASSGKRAG